jgi:hypothetical protein
MVEGVLTPENDGGHPDDRVAEQDAVAVPEEEQPDDPAADLGDGWVRA